MLRPLLPLLAADTRNVVNLSETELIARFPAVEITVGILFLAGLVADVYLLIRWQVARSEGRSLWQVTPKPWDVAELAVAALLFFGSYIGLGVLLYFFPPGTSATLAIEFVVRAGLLTLLFIFLTARKINRLAAFGLSGRCPGRSIAGGLLLYVAAVPVLLVLMIAQERLCRLVGWEVTAQKVVQLFVTSKSLVTLTLLTAFAVVVAPVFEEVFFRGFAYPVLKERLGLGPAMVVTSVAFAVIHFHLASLVPLFALAVALTLAYEICGSILAPIALHAAFNLANVLLLFYVRVYS